MLALTLLRHTSSTLTSRSTSIKLAEHRQLEKHLAEQFLAFNTLKDDSGQKKEIEFETKLRALLDHYGSSMKHIINLLAQHSGKRGTASSATPRPRKPRQNKSL